MSGRLHKLIVYRNGEFFDVRVASPGQPEQLEGLRRERFHAVCFCGKSALASCSKCGYVTPRDRARTALRSYFEDDDARTIDKQLRASLQAVLRGP
jgi:hypothetical protein